jgi:hypothetical protein
MKDRAFILTVIYLTALGMLQCAVAAETASPRNYLEPSPNGRYLQWQDGTPFYIHSDTAWALPRDYSRDEVIEYLDKTFEQKFNAVQMSAVFHAVRPNQDLVGPAFHEGDFLRPKEDYWTNVDWAIPSGRNNSPLPFATMVRTGVVPTADGLPGGTRTTRG